MYYYTILCRVVGGSNATAIAYAIPFATLPLAAPFHYASNAYIYIPYSPALRVYYHYFQNSPETRYLPVFVREYETYAPSSIKSAGRDADV